LIEEGIGDDPTREGLRKTPERVIRAWEELFAGYGQDPAQVFTTFEADGYDQIVLMRDIELFSVCEHHLLPFFGRAHVAYVPGERVVGASKLARLLEIYSRRLQIQERIGEQVTEAIMRYLGARGAACIIEAEHLCMRMRGVNKQHSTLVTSSVRGVFRTDYATRAELISLIQYGSR